MINRHPRYTLHDALDAYVDRRTLSAGAVRKLTASVHACSRQIGNVTVDAITHEMLNEWIAIEEKKFHAATVIGHQASVITILRAMADDGRCQEPVSRKIRRPRKPKPLPKAWTIEELRRVQATCDDLPGELKRFGTCVPVCVYFGCFVRFAYETGLRRGNLFSLRQTNINDDGTCYVKHEKTGQPHVCEISQVALALFRQLPGEFPLRWRNCSKFYRRWKLICKAAKVPHGGPQRIRKTAATQVWLEQQDNPSRVQQFLGHLTGDMWRHYVDQSQGTNRPPKPPSL